jgi:glycosyltransferase involved in cell wall biosynthesis
MKVSVIIPTYNRYEPLKQALSSVYAQTYTPYEVIVIDDGSTDATSQIKKDFPNIIYIYQENSGVSSARNHGIKVASSEWIAFLDSDDEWLKEKLEMQVLFHEKNKVLMSYTQEIWLRDNKLVNIPKKFQKIGKNVFLENLSYCNLAPSSVFIHSNVFDEIGLFDESMEVCEDYDLWLRIALKFDIALIPKDLIRKYGGAEDQLSMKYKGLDRFHIYTLEKLLPLKTSYSEQIRETLLRKYKIILKGAIKYNKANEIAHYEEKIFVL